MPVYSYVCRKCGTQFDILHKNTSEQKNVECVSCGSIEIEKKFAPFSVGSPASSSVTRGVSCPSGSPSSCAMRGQCPGCG